MKGLIAVVVVLAALSLIMLKTQSPEISDGVTKSSRQLANTPGRAASGRNGKATLAGLEEYAAGLSDEELWRALQQGCRSWLENPESDTWSRPPDLVVILAREIGSRDGVEGVIALVDLLEELDQVAGESQSSRESSKIPRLALSLRYGALGGWSFDRPEEAIAWILDHSQDPTDPDSTALFPGLFPLAKFYPSHGMIDSLAAERVMRTAFAKVAAADPAEASLLLLELTPAGIDPNSILGVVLPELDTSGKERLLVQVAAKIKETGIPGTDVFWRKLSDFSPDGSSSELLPTYAEALVRMHPEKVVEWITDSSFELETRKVLYWWNAFHTPEGLELIEHFSPTEQWDVLKFATIDPSLISFGPIDGQRGGLVDRPMEYFRELHQAIEESDLTAGKKAELQNSLRKETEE